MPAIDDILTTLRGAGTDLSRLYLRLGGTDMETQPMTDEGGHARITETYHDYDLRAPLERVGTTWRNWDTGRCVAIALDIDHIDDHPTTGYTSEQIAAAVESSPPYIAWYWSRRGRGVTGIVQLDAPARTRADQSELGRRLRAKLAADGMDVSMIDCCGGNSWVWWRGATGRAHMLIRGGDSMLTIDDLPELPPEERTTDRSALPGLPASLSPKQRADLEILRTHGRCPPQYDPTSGAYRVHTCDMHLIDPTAKTISPGTDPSPNSYALPRGDGSWTLFRYGGVAEHESWQHRDGRTWIVLNPHLEHDLDFSGDYRPSTGQPVTTEPPDKYASIQPVPLSRLRKEYPVKATPVIDGLLRIAEVMNIIASPKIGKSWLVYYILLCIVTGRPIFGFPTLMGMALLIDNELKAATIWDRIDTVAGAMGIPPEEYEGKIHVCALRGNIQNLNQIEEGIINRQEAGKYVIAVIDSLYRTNPGGSAGENDNGAVTMAYNQLDRMAERLQAGVVLIHHSSKGSQADKAITDIGSGAGSQSRAADAHVVLRDHVDDNCVVWEAKVRSFPPAEPRVIRWQHPLWTVVPDADPTQLRRPTKADPKAKLIERETARAEAQRTKDERAKEIILDRLKQGPLSLRKLTLALTGTEVIKTHLPRLLEEMTQAELIEQRPAMVAGNQCLTYMTRA